MPRGRGGGKERGGGGRGRGGRGGRGRGGRGGGRGGAAAASSGRGWAFSGHTTALIVAPPAEAFSAINAIRCEHDRAYPRWMPHVNMLYPFFADSHFGDAEKLLRRRLAAVKPFKLRLASFDHFAHKAKCVVWLAPETPEEENALLDLHAALMEVFPECSDQLRRGKFTPHLTCGQWPKTEVEAAKAGLGEGWETIEWTCDHVQIISRSDGGNFVVKRRVPLGGAEAVPETPAVAGGAGGD